MAPLEIMNSLIVSCVVIPGRTLQEATSCAVSGQNTIKDPENKYETLTKSRKLSLLPFLPRNMVDFFQCLQFAPLKNILRAPSQNDVDWSVTKLIEFRSSYIDASFDLRSQT